MKNYIRADFFSLTKEEAEILMAELAAIDYYAFDNDDFDLSAYIEAEKFSETLLRELLPPGCSYEVGLIEEQNWNARWESSYDPVIVKDFAAVRAHFHQPVAGIKYDIIITPKMSFGTGHHATTYMMMEMMREIPMKNKSVIDFGTGTGVLAVLADKMGASGVIAIDNDPGCIENATENIMMNKSKNVALVLAGAPGNDGDPVDIMLANINLNILMGNSKGISKAIKPGGTLLVSGIMLPDREKICAAFVNAGFEKTGEHTKDGWLAVSFKRLH